MLRLLPVVCALASLTVAAQADGGAATSAADAGTVTWELPEVPPEATGRFTQAAMAGKPLWATFRTTKGDFVVRLLSEEAPNTVANFVALAAGEREWTHPFTLQRSKRPLYDGTTFHRIFPGFAIQGGDPTATGRGGPGYRFSDEVGAARGFDRPGLLAMANFGPNTNGSQFFITVTPKDRLPHHLDGKHTIFGEVVAGYEVVLALSQVPVDSKGTPVGEQLSLTRVEITDRAPKGAAKTKQP